MQEKFVQAEGASALTLAGNKATTTKRVQLDGGRHLALMLIGGVDREGVFLGDDEHLDRMATGTMTGNVLFRQQTPIGGDAPKLTEFLLVPPMLARDRNDIEYASV